MLYYMYDIMLYIYYTVLNLLPPITYPPFPKREIYQFTVLPFYHPNNPPLLSNTRALLSNKVPLLRNKRSLLKKDEFFLLERGKIRIFAKEYYQNLLLGC